MTSPSAPMKSIWYFVGLTLLEMGALVFLAGLIDYLSAAKPATILSNTYPGLWWGGLMMACGFGFFWLKRK